MNNDIPTPLQGESHPWYTRLYQPYRMPGEHVVTALADRFSPFERALFFLFSTLLVVGAFASIAELRTHVTVSAPAEGGSIVEGVVGSPRFVNPVLALSDTDRDMTALVFTGLLRADPETGLVLDIAKRYEISSDGTAYKFVLRDDAYFHDGHPVTADDVIFTIDLIQDPNLKSPKRADWDGVRVEKHNDRELTITLPKPFAPFLENATLGIVPKHIWEKLTVQEIPFSERNIDAVGAGPFKIQRVLKNSEGIPTEYRLARYHGYTQGAPYLSSMTVRFFTRHDDLAQAWRNGTLDTVSSLSPEAYNRTMPYTLARGTFPRVFAVFFNQDRNPALRDAAARTALSFATDKEAVIQEALLGFGTAIDSPVMYQPLLPTNTEERVAETLTEGGWTWSEESGQWTKGGVPFSFKLATANVPELRRAADALVQSWQRHGITVTVAVFEPGDLQQTIIRPREYDALLFGQAIGREPDLYAFWHSSQREDPGLNVALYANKRTDDLLSKARATTDAKERADLHTKIAKEIQADMPALFLYTPDFLYGVTEHVHGVALETVSTPSDRFGNIHRWYRHTERVWEFLQ